MVRFINDANLVEALQGQIPAFRGVLTSNNRPLVHLDQQNVVRISHTDFHAGAICEFGQLPHQIRIYTEALTVAQANQYGEAANAARKRQSALATLLDLYMPVAARSPWESLSDEMDEDEMDEEPFGFSNDGIPSELKEFFEEVLGISPEKRAKLKKGKLALAMAQHGIDPRGIDSIENFTTVKGIDVEDITEDMFVYLRDWYKTSVEVRVFDLLPDLLSTVLMALERERDNRATAVQLEEAKAEVQRLNGIIGRLNSDYEASLNASRVEYAVKAIRAMGVNVGEGREAAVREMFGDLADQVLAALEVADIPAEQPDAVVTNDGATGGDQEIVFDENPPSSELPDWLTEGDEALVEQPDAAATPV